MSVASITDTRQYLTFQLGEEVFGLDVANVREILEFTTVTKVPGTPEYMKGVINLRGSVVPVMDMRLKFNLTASEKTVNTCIIVMEISSFEGEQIVIGALVDSVQEVFELGADEIEPAPKIGIQLRNEFIVGMGKRGDQFIILLDVDRIFSSEDLIATQETETAGQLELAGNE